MNSQGVFILTWLLLFIGVQAQPRGIGRLTPGRVAPPLPSGPPYSCSKIFCLDSRKCWQRPGSLMPCVSYTLPRTFASCGSILQEVLVKGSDARGYLQFKRLNYKKKEKR